MSRHLIYSLTRSRTGGFAASQILLAKYEIIFNDTFGRKVGGSHYNLTVAVITSTGGPGKFIVTACEPGQLYGV